MPQFRVKQRFKLRYSTTLALPCGTFFEFPTLMGSLVGDGIILVLNTSRDATVFRYSRDALMACGAIAVAVEMPIAFRYGDVPYAVMMATPHDLKDFAIGFSISEKIILQTSDIRDIATTEQADGVVVDITLQTKPFAAFLSGHRRRNLRGRTSCGVCGVEDLNDIQREHPLLTTDEEISVDAIEAAVSSLWHHQYLSHKTRCAHAAAWVTPDGTIAVVREDVGRHNALDKLIGATSDADNRGFCLVTSRCSYEMAEKAITAGMSILVSMSTPTALAIEIAHNAGLTLAMAGKTGIVAFANPKRIVNAVRQQIETRVCSVIDTASPPIRAQLPLQAAT